MKLKQLLAVAVTSLLGMSAHAALDTRLIASGLSQPLYATAPSNDGRVFVVQRNGSIKVVQGGVTSEFLSIAVGIESGVPSERGLLGLAFDPGYANPASTGYRRFFVNYTEPVTLHSVIASYRTSDNPSVALASSRTEVLRISERSESQYHKGGWLGFKPGDGDHLYVGVGDGTQAANAQSLGSLLGKVLRIDINNDAFPGDPERNYAIPADNPFVGSAGARGEVFAWGLRNPWRSSFDRLSGDLWIGDVGLNTREEINFVAAASGGGQNFGWSHREGTAQGPGGAAPPGSSFVEPVLDYPHAAGSNSVIGGYVMHGNVDTLDGQYVFGDWRNGGHVWAIPTDAQSFADATDLTALINAGQGGPLSQIASFGEGASGELYIVDYRSGKVVQVVPEPGTVLLFAAGLLLLVLRARSRPSSPALR
jgi:glucose/arabinose dehydrogenase